MIKRFTVTIASLLALCVIAALVLLDTADETYTVSEKRLENLPASVLAEKKRRDEAEPVCLLVLNSGHEAMNERVAHMQEVLDLMRIGYDCCDLATEMLPDPSDYDTVVLALNNLEPLSGYLDMLTVWVEQGGHLMFQTVMDQTAEFVKMAPVVGITNEDMGYTNIYGFYIESEFMIGSKGGFSVNLKESSGEEYQGLRIMNVHLDEESAVHVWSDDERGIPVIWSRDLGDGRIVCMNYDYFSKSTRGMTCAAYSLLEDCCIYPVINASSFFIDDFPSPVPFGTSEYILRDYNLSIADFYTKIWWPDMLKLANAYGIKYTGLLIEDYTDRVTGEFLRQTSTERYNHFGASLLNHGGEIGLDGYNHQPLVFGDYVFDENLNYNAWLDETDMKTAFDEMISFIHELYPEIVPNVYIPPSNILSDVGREFLVRNYPQIKTISGLYIGDAFTYEQEFQISDDGIIEFPRLTSDSIMDEYSYFDQINAMTMYYVASHFIHPDDALDPERGAEYGWAQLYKNTTEFFDWIYSSAKGIRSMTASDGAQAVARYDTLSVNRTETDEMISLRLGGFWDEAYLLMRFNDGAPGDVNGGTVEQISENLYLLRATSSRVIIKKA